MALSDPDLALIVSQWPTLSEAVRRPVVATVKAAGGDDARGGSKQ